MQKNKEKTCPSMILKTMHCISQIETKGIKTLIPQCKQVLEITRPKLIHNNVEEHAHS